MESLPSNVLSTPSAIKRAIERIGAIQKLSTGVVWLNLASLGLTDDGLEVLNREGRFDNLENLNVLDLSNNKLTKIPQGMLQKFPNLGTLIVSKNELKEILPEDINYLTKLTTLHAPKNHLEKIPDFYDLPKKLAFINVVGAKNQRIGHKPYVTIIQPGRELRGEIEKCAISYDKNKDYAGSAYDPFGAGINDILKVLNTCTLPFGKLNEYDFKKDVNFFVQKSGYQHNSRLTGIIERHKSTMKKFFGKCAEIDGASKLTDLQLRGLKCLFGKLVDAQNPAESDLALREIETTIADYDDPVERLLNRLGFEYSINNGMEISEEEIKYQAIYCHIEENVELFRIEDHLKYLNIRMLTNSIMNNTPLYFAIIPEKGKQNAMKHFYKQTGRQEYDVDSDKVDAIVEDFKRSAGLRDEKLKRMDEILDDASKKISAIWGDTSPTDAGSLLEDAIKPLRYSLRNNKLEDLYSVYEKYLTEYEQKCRNPNASNVARKGYDERYNNIYSSPNQHSDTILGSSKSLSRNLSSKSLSSKSVSPEDREFRGLGSGY